MAMTTSTIKMKLNSVDRALNRLHVGKKVSFIRASLCARAANFWNLIRKAFNNYSFYIRKFKPLANLRRLEVRFVSKTPIVGHLVKQLNSLCRVSQ